MTRPDPRKDLCGSIEYMTDLLEEVLSEREERRLSGAAAAIALGHGSGYFARKPWRVPGFGLQGFMHSLRVWREWNEKPEVDRRAEWDKLSAAERAKARGIAS